MNHKNKIKFELKIVPKNQVLELDGILFSNIAYVLVFVDDINLLTLEMFQESFLVFEELKKSISKSGSYLLFTCVCGIADDAGWEYVEVLHDQSSVIWNIRREDTSLSYVFEKSDYLKEILMIEHEIENLDGSIRLEPLHVVYPE